MQYMGGKFMIRKPLSAAIRGIVGDCAIWEPFCGGLNLSGWLLPAVCSDVEPSLIALYRAVADGWDPPEVVTEEQWRAAKSLPVHDPMHAFCAFGCSFGGKKWDGYSRGRAQRNYAGGSRRAVLRDVAAVVAAGGRFRHSDFMTADLPEQCAAVYCDPPYADTTGYSAGAFDHCKFWARCRELSERVPVLVSEYQAPDDWVEVWHIERGMGMRRDGAVGRRVERLFVHRSNA